MQKNLISELTFSFSLKIIDLYQHLKDRNEYVISKQLLRSSTSIGANVVEALDGSSKRDFMYKMSIAKRGARETQYWLKLLSRSLNIIYLTDNQPYNVDNYLIFRVQNCKGSATFN